MTEAATHDLENVLDDLGDAAEASDKRMSVGDVLEAFEARSFGALLTLVALIAALPVIGAIPGVSILTGTLIVLIAGQYVVGRTTPWIPERLRQLSVGADSMRSGVEAARPYAARIDKVVRPRLTFLTSSRAAKTVIAAGAVALALLFYPMALVPGGVWPPALSVMALGLALLSGDGVLALVGGVGGVGSIAALFWLF